MSLELTVARNNTQLDTIVPRHIPNPLFARRALAREPRAAERVNVERAVKVRYGVIRCAIEVRLLKKGKT